MGHVDTSIPNNVVILHLDLLLTLVYLSDPSVVTIMGHVDTSIPNNVVIRYTSIYMTHDCYYWGTSDKYTRVRRRSKCKMTTLLGILVST